MSESEQAHAAAVALPGGRVVVLPKGPDRQPIEVPASVVEVLADVLDHVQRGEHVRVIADDEEVTTQQASDLLHVSRPYLVGLVDRGETCSPIDRTSRPSTYIGPAALWPLPYRTRSSRTTTT